MPGRSCAAGAAPGSSIDALGRPQLHVLITRPRAQATSLAREVEAQGHTVLIEPLLTIEPISDVVLPLDGVQGVVLTSTNAVPALTAAARCLPIFAVGTATAAAARRAGCNDVTEAEGDAASLARRLTERCRPSDGAFLHLSGAEIRGGLAEHLADAGFELRRQVVYRAVAAEALSSAARDALAQRAIDAVLLFSPRSAKILVQLVTKSGLATYMEDTVAICLSRAVVEPCRTLRWRSVRVADRPEWRALLELLDAAEGRC